MKSAYAVLGVPGNASPEDIEDAFRRCRAHYSKEKLASDPKSVDNLREITEAYRILSNPEFRIAHDRKLSNTVGRPATQQPRVIIEREESPWFSKPLNVIAIAVVLMIASGAYISHSRLQERKLQAARELAQQKKEAEEAALAKQEAERAEAERYRRQVELERREQQFRIESNRAYAAAVNADAQRQAQAAREQEAERREAQRRAQEAKQEERQRVYEAERRLAREKQLVRELCSQRYGHPNC